jgi:exopolysaccharide biosynthesis polyprenyl glycosylphosphotransferase
MTTDTNIHFELSERKLLLRILDVTLVLLGLHFIGIIFEFDYFTIHKEKWVWSLILGFYILFFGTIFEIYNLRKASDFFTVLKGIILTSSVTILVYLLTPYFTPSLPASRIQILFFYLSMISSMSIGRLAYVYLINSPRFVKNVILIADGDRLEEIEQNFALADANYNIKYYINTTNDSQEIAQGKEVHSSDLKDIVSKGIHEIVVTNSSRFSSIDLYNDLLDVFNQGHIIKEYSQVYENLSGRVYVNFKNDQLYKQFPFSEHNVKPVYRLVHRFFDVIISSFGILILLLLIPFLLLINVFINKGPLLYTQERVGKKGKSFKIYKLRSMVVDAEKNGAVWAEKNDMRITKFGKFLRKTRLDEFPQFFNILKGEMSVIGPRPERPIFVADLSKKIPFYPTRHIIKPGLTGWAQVNTSYGASVEDSLTKLQYDLFYIKHRNVFLDLNIAIKTLSTVIFYRGQ